MRIYFVKGVPINSQDPLDVRIKDKTGILALRLRLEGKLMNKVGKIVVHILEVGHDLEYFGMIEHKGSSGRELDVSSNFVHSDRADDVATLVGALLYMFLPLFLYALFCGGSAVSSQQERRAQGLQEGHGRSRT
jgi:hypothetical protein